MTEQNFQYLRWRVIARRHPPAFLLAAQLLSLVLYPLFGGMPGGRVLVMLEQFAGVGYFAVVVSRLIGLTMLKYQQ